jgi:queuine tRNA-ribosyltransferase
MNKNFFKVKKKCGFSRLSLVSINDKFFFTPVFMPVGTMGVIKTLSSYDLEILKFRIILTNTLHVFFNINKKVLKNNINIHNFIKWKKIILTDSGGYQAYSLKSKIIHKNGIIFKNKNNNINLTPKKCMNIQTKIGSDINVVLDECPENYNDFLSVYYSLKLSNKWSIESKKFHNKNSILFGIIHGGIYPDLRKISLYETKKIEFDGYSIGGLGIGENYFDFKKILKYIVKNLPSNKPRYLMGFGFIKDILLGVKLGIDMFDCVIPTRHARNGFLYTFSGIVKIKKKKYALSKEPIDKKCICSICKNYTKSYINYLFKIKETLAYRLCTIHNLSFYEQNIRNIKRSIISKNIYKLKLNGGK